jgi:hypothetical protein
MKRITVTVNKESWDCLYKYDAIRYLKRTVDKEYESRRSQLRIVGKEEKPKEADKTTSNLIRIGPPPDIKYKKIKLDIEDSLYNSLVWVAERHKVSVRELIDKRVNDCMEFHESEVAELTRVMLINIGLPYMEIVKEKEPLSVTET